MSIGSDEKQVGILNRKTKFIARANFLRDSCACLTNNVTH